MKAITFEDGETIIVEILSGPSTTGLYRVRTPEGKVIIRHKDRLSFISE